MADNKCKLASTSKNDYTPSKWLGSQSFLKLTCKSILRKFSQPKIEGNGYNFLPQ